MSIRSFNVCKLHLKANEISNYSMSNLWGVEGHVPYSHVKYWAIKKFKTFLSWFEFKVMPWLGWTLENVGGVFSYPPNLSFLVFSQRWCLEHLKLMYLQQHELKWLDIYNTNLMWAVRIVYRHRIVKHYERRGSKNSTVKTHSLCP